MNEEIKNLYKEYKRSNISKRTSSDMSPRCRKIYGLLCHNVFMIVGKTPDVINRKDLAFLIDEFLNKNN